MDERLEAVVRGALGQLSGSAQGSTGQGPSKSELRIAGLTMAQFSRLASLQAGDPLVDEVLDALRTGRPVLLDRLAVEDSLGLADYPKSVREEFTRWFERISGYGLRLAGRPPEPRTPEVRPANASVEQGFCAAPERQILSEILGESHPEARPCYVEPGKSCSGCSRCRTLGF